LGKQLQEESRPFLAGYTITYNLIDFLLLLGISIVAAVIVEKLMHQITPGGFFGAFLLALIGSWLFIPFVPLTRESRREGSDHAHLADHFLHRSRPRDSGRPLLRGAFQETISASEGIGETLFLSPIPFAIP